MVYMYYSVSCPVRFSILKCKYVVHVDMFSVSVGSLGSILFLCFILLSVFSIKNE